MKLRWAIAALGVVLVLGGLAHWAGIAHHYWSAGLPEPRHFALMILIGAAQIAAGGLDLLAASALKRHYRGGARALYVSAFLIAAYAVPIFPVLREAGLLFRIAPNAYLVAHLVLAAIFIARSDSSEPLVQRKR